MRQVLNSNLNILVEKNEKVAQTFIEAWSAHDSELLATLFDEDCCYEEIATGRSFTDKMKIAQYLETTISGIPDSVFIASNVLAGDQMAVVEWIWKGTNSSGWVDLSIPATNNRFRLRGISVMEIEKGLIKRNSDYWDWNSLIQQILRK